MKIKFQIHPTLYFVALLGQKSLNIVSKIMHKQTENSFNKAVKLTLLSMKGLVPM